MKTETICADIRRAVHAEVMRAARRAKPVSECRGRLMPAAALMRRLRRAFA